MALADELGAKFYKLVSMRTGPCTNHGADPCEECLEGGVDAAKEWQAAHSCATCRWAERNEMGDFLFEDDGVTVMDGFEDHRALKIVQRYSLACGRAAMSGGDPKEPATLAFTMDGSEYRGELLITPDFGCVMWEAKP